MMLADAASSALVYRELYGCCWAVACDEEMEDGERSFTRHG